MTNIISIRDKIVTSKGGCRSYQYVIHLVGGGRWIVKPKKGRYPEVVSILRRWVKILNCQK